jgi:hypothetical protein
MKSIIVLLLLSPIYLLSQDKQFSIAVNKDTVLMGNTIKVEFTVKNAQGEFEAPEFAEFDIIMGPSTSSSFSNINGKVSNTAKYTYLIKPKSEGEFFIENAYILDENDEDNNMQTEPFKIVVIPNPEGIIEDDGNPYMNSQFFNFSWPSEIIGEEDIQKNPKTDKSSKPKRKVKKI